MAHCGVAVDRCGWFHVLVTTTFSFNSAPSIQVLAIRYQFNGFGVFWDTLYISYNNVA